MVTMDAHHPRCIHNHAQMDVLDLMGLLLAKIVATSVCVGGGLVSGNSLNSVTMLTIQSYSKQYNDCLNAVELACFTCLPQVGGLFAPSLFLGALVGDIMGSTLLSYNPAVGVVDSTSYVSGLLKLCVNVHVGKFGVC